METIDIDETLGLALRAHEATALQLVEAEIAQNELAALEIGGRLAELKSIIDSCRITKELMKRSKNEQ